MKYQIVFPGFPGRMTSGTLGWGAMVYIEQGSHKILFDTAGPAKRIQVRQRLKELNIDPNQIDTLIFSHFHYDHVYNYDYFPNARILMHEVEANWVSETPDNYAIPPQFFPAIQRSHRLELIRKDEEVLPGISSLFVPGHTPGEIALVLHDADMPVTVLAGDAVKNIAELATGQVPKAWDQLASSQSIKKIRDMAEIVIPGHDRILKVTEDQIIAISSIHETIVIPAGVAEKENSKNFELVIAPTSLNKQKIF